MALLVLAALALASADRIARRVLTEAIARQTGAGVRLDALDLGLRDSSLRLGNLVLSNPPGFGTRALLVLPELYLAYDPEAAASNALRFREVRLHLSELNLAVDSSGRTNLMELAGRAGRERGLEATNLLGEFTFEGIDQLTLTLGRLTFTDQRDPRRDLTIDLGITNRSFLQVHSLSQLLPLALEIALKGGLGASQIIPAK